MAARHALLRLLQPRHVAVFGGRPAAEVVRQCRRIGFAGPIWPVHPTQREVESLPCFRSVAELPEAPDASFVAVPREATVAVVSQLAARGAGGAVCYASGFAEFDETGAMLQRELVTRAGDLALIGPNCYGLLNYLDGLALWPDQHGGSRVQRGVAIIAQSGNIALNLTMQKRSLPIAYVISAGNKAGLEIEDLIQALIQDSRVSAIGLHLEGLSDARRFAAVAAEAREHQVPIAVLKVGRSSAGASLVSSHTRTLAGDDQLYDALFSRLGIARVADLDELLETLKLLHVFGPLPGGRIVSMSCSGGEATLVADLAEEHGLSLPAIPPAPAAALRELLGERVNVCNPLDYQTYIWPDRAALTACFTHTLATPCEAALLILDYPRADRCSVHGWDVATDALLAAHRVTGTRACVVSSIADNLPEEVGRALLEAGIAPMQGLRQAILAIRGAASIGARAAPAERQLLESGAGGSATRQVTEFEAKQQLAAFGVNVPAARLSHSVDDAIRAAEQIGYPVVVKAVSATIAHKTELGAVRLNLGDANAVRSAASALMALGEALLVERMIGDGIAELIVGVSADPVFGLALTLGSGGVLVELVADAATVLLPASRADLLAALRSLRVSGLVTGHRGSRGLPLERVIDDLEPIIRFAEAHAHTLVELDVNPLIVTSRGCVAVDALLRVATRPGIGEPAGRTHTD